MQARSLAYLLIAALGGAAGCSSISDSISSPFESSSASSRSLEGRESSFRRDVQDYTATFARSDGDFAVFEKGVGDLAAKHGVSNWESDSKTYVAIGKGLRQAGASAGQLEAYVANIARGDQAKAAAIRQGYGG